MKPSLFLETNQAENILFQGDRIANPTSVGTPTGLSSVSYSLYIIWSQVAIWLLFVSIF